MAVNKVEYAGIVLLDLTSDTVSADKMLEGTTAHSKDGSIVTGTIKDCGNDVFDAFEPGIGRKSDGFSWNNGLTTYDLSEKSAIKRIRIPRVQASKTITSNGTFYADSPQYSVVEKINVNVPIPTFATQEKTVTENGEVTPDQGYDGLSKVVVNVPTGGVTKETLWTNNAPTKSFASQTVTLNQDATNFDLIEVKWNPSTTATNTRSTLFDTTYLDVAYSYMFGGRNVNTGGSNSYSRNAYLTASNTMTIGQAYRQNSTTTQNTAIIPVEIIGWKL